MSTPRYFKSTNGTMTVFRRSETRVYLSARFGPGHPISFSTKPPAGAASHLATEITGREYTALVKLKYDRHFASDEAGDGEGPQDSWIYNTALEAC